MTRPTSDDVRNTAANLIALPDTDFAPALAAALAGFLPNFFVSEAAIRDRAGNQSRAFEAVVSVTRITDSIADADSVACAICVCSTLDETGLSDSYD